MTTSVPQPPGWQVRRSALAVFALTAALLLLTTGGHTYAIDEETMLSAAYGVLERGNLTLSAGADAPVSTYGPGQSIAAVPLLWLALQLAALLPASAETWLVRAVLSWFNPLVTAAAAAWLVPLLARRHFSARASVATALIYAFATMAWPQSKTFFAEPLTAWLLLVALDAAERAGPQRVVPLLFAGFVAGLTVSVKIQALICLPVLGLLVLRPALIARDVRRLLRDASAWGLAAVAALALLLIYQWQSFGSPFATGYGSAPASIFRNDLLPGLYGLLLSPGKSLLLYAPPLLLLPWALLRFARRDAVLAAAIAALLLINLLFYARLNFWHGDGAWGPRYLNIILPLLVLPLAELAAAWSAQRSVRIALSAVLLAAVPVQLAGVTINLNAYLGVQPDAETRYFVPSQSPILGQLRLLSSQLQQDLRARFQSPAVWLRDGWSYSEGDRAQAQQLPRWSNGSATIALRPAGDAAVQLDLLIDGCRPAPIAPATLTLQIAASSTTFPAACPPRRIALRLPPQSTLLTLLSDRWQPRDAALDRDETLGVLLHDLTVRQGDAALPLVGRLVPLTPMPTDNIVLRRWNSDYRNGHYDFWWWYLRAAPLTPPQYGVTLAIWLVVPALLLISGLRELRRAPAA